MSTSSSPPIPPAPPPSPTGSALPLAGRVCVVTGGTAGIGRASAAGLAALGAQVVLPCRTMARGEASARELSALGGGEVRAMPCDLASQASIRAFAGAFSREFPRLDVLLNSAGIVSYRRQETQDGLEATFGVTYLGAYLLTRLLLPRLQESSPARIVNVAGEFHRRVRLDFDDLQSERSYGFIRAGARAMLAKVTFSFALAKRLEGTGVSVNCLHPGPVRSELLRDLPWYLRAGAALARPLMLSAAAGAETPIYLASAPEVAGISGEYFAKKRPRRAAALAYDLEQQERLWSASAALCGLPPDSLGGAGRPVRPGGPSGTAI